MAKCTLIRKKDRKYDTMAGPPGAARISREVTESMSKTMGVGFVEFEKIAMPWTCHYDEYLYCVEGELHLHDGDTVHVMQPGDGLWIPEGAPIVYEAKERALVLFTLYPVDWKKRMGG